MSAHVRLALFVIVALNLWKLEVRFHFLGVVAVQLLILMVSYLVVVVRCTLIDIAFLVFPHCADTRAFIPFMTYVTRNTYSFDTPKSLQ